MSSSGRKSNAHRQERAPLKRGEILAALGVAFVAMIGVGILTPIMPFLAKDLGVGALKISIIVAAFPFAEAFAGVVFGRIANLRRYKLLMLVGLSVAAGAYLVFAFGQTFSILLLARLLAGTGSGTIVVAQSYLMDQFGEKDHAKALGMVGAAASAGVVFGLLLGAGLGENNEGRPLYREASLIAATLTAITVLLVASYIPGRRTAQLAVMNADSSTNFQLSRVFAPLFSYGLNTTLFMGFAVAISFVFQRNFGLSVSATAVAFIAIGVVVALVQGKAIAPLHAMLSPKRIAILGFLSMGVALALAASFVENVILFSIGCLLATIAYAVLVPTLLETATSAVSETQASTVLGAAVVFSAAGSVIGPVSCGYFFDHLGADAALVFFAIAAFFSVFLEFARPRG
jgi:MFS transporter, DHA1 family, tetracycline resistance protein